MNASARWNCFPQLPVALSNEKHIKVNFKLKINTQFGFLNSRASTEERQFKVNFLWRLGNRSQIFFLLWRLRKRSEEAHLLVISTWQLATSCQSLIFHSNMQCQQPGHEIESFNQNELISVPLICMTGHDCVWWSKFIQQTIQLIARVWLSLIKI